MNAVLLDIVRPMREGVWLPTLFAGAEVNDEIEFEQFLGSACLALIVDFRFHKPEEVVVVRIDSDLLPQPLEQMAVVL